ncbi:unnamed protein product [Rhizoctonia solani]|uniref:Zn(2)-C6 fungal-type domain-containing protein n=1 Tax=Rhizoctonia solani TaxID=456999 RepID=A0A8H3I2Y7_9AGAM|nr:unnamed protein product [Rhizoctonia solani]
MSQNSKNAPGPIGTSCMTCKRRHQKCDMRQPTCLKCEQQRLECLGYSHNRRGVMRSAAPKVLKPRPIKPKGQETDNLSPAQPVAISLQSRPSSEETSSQSGRSSSSELEALPGSTNDPDLSSTESLQSLEPCHSGPGTLIQRGDRRGIALTTQDYLRLFSPKSYRSHTTVISPSLHQLFLIFSRLPVSPSDPIIAYLDSPQFEIFFMSYFRRMTSYSYFRPVKDQTEELQTQILQRIRSSHFSRWVMLVCAKICEAIVDGDNSQTALHYRWLGDIEMVLRRRLSQDPTPHEADSLRGDSLEISLLKTALGRSSNAYTVLRNATPNFLQTTYGLPDLWSSDSDPTLIPLLNLIGSKYHGLTAFALVDCTFAMLFGLPQQVEYDTGSGTLPKGFLAQEWSYSTPTKSHILLADINACRDQSLRARDWREIERTILDWQAQAIQHDEDWESWMKVAWIAVQESWRLALLVYLYLSVCGLTSDDPRIQRCVTQIIQVVATVKKHESPDICVPFLTQFLMVGICAQSEKHRDIARKKLSSTSETKFWMLQGVDFVPVLDHLWHGAGSDGRPVTWGDYVRSREAMLPIPI